MPLGLFLRVTASKRTRRTLDGHVPSTVVLPLRLDSNGCGVWRVAHSAPSKTHARLRPNEDPRPMVSNTMLWCVTTVCLENGYKLVSSYAAFIYIIGTISHVTVSPPLSPSQPTLEETITTHLHTFKCTRRSWPLSMNVYLEQPRASGRTGDRAEEIDSQVLTHRGPETGSMTASPHRKRWRFFVRVRRRRDMERRKEKGGHGRVEARVAQLAMLTVDRRSSPVEVFVVDKKQRTHRQLRNFILYCCCCAGTPRTHTRFRGPAFSLRCDRRQLAWQHRLALAVRVNRA